MNLRLILIASLFLIFNLTPAVASAQTLDQYGGYKDLPVPGGATGHFRVAKLNNRWIFATPDGNAFWMTGVYNVNIDDHVTDLGTTYTQVCDAKYGDHRLTWGPQQNRRLKSWGFNTLGEYASGYTLPWATSDDPRWPGKIQPVKMAAIPFPLQAAWYSQTNRNSYAPGPVKELYWAMDSHFTGYRGQFPDVFDPNFDLWVNARAASSEYARYAASPWLIGFSSDDTDYLTGFGPGPDFDSRGHGHPHLGYVTLLTPPTQTRNKAGTITYTDPKVYTKYALRDFLQARYGSIAALNAAWGSAYTTFDSNGGWPTGSGLLDENGKGRWVGTDSVGLTNTAPTVKADLDDFLYEIAKRYFSIYRTRIKQYYPNALYLGPTTVGGWDAPARRQVLRAAGQYLDVLRTTWNGDQARLDFMAQHAGDLPIVTWLGAKANPDSALFRYTASGFQTQLDRGTYYQNSLTARVNAAVTTTGVHPFVGIQWWEFHDNWAEKANWGLVTLSDNAYDGKEAIVAAGKDPWGYPTGGENYDHGNFLGPVIQAHAQIYARLFGTVPPSAPTAPTGLSINSH